MSLGASAIGELAIGAQASLASATTRKPPRKRVAVARSDTVAQPEPR
jgi:hypothetical protein